MPSICDRDSQYKMVFNSSIYPIFIGFGACVYDTRCGDTIKMSQRIW